VYLLNPRIVGRKPSATSDPPENRGFSPGDALSAREDTQDAGRGFGSFDASVQRRRTVQPIDRDAEP
jgi:hypothetical protein